MAVAIYLRYLHPNGAATDPYDCSEQKESVFTCTLDIGDIESTLQANKNHALPLRQDAANCVYLSTYKYTHIYICVY